MGRQGQEHTDTRASAACRDVQSPASPGETPVKPQSRGSVKSLGTCRTEWVAVRDSGGEHTDTQVCTQAHAH